METALPLIAVLGFFAGTLVVPQILRWIALLLAVTGKLRGRLSRSIAAALAVGSAVCCVLSSNPIHDWRARHLHGLLSLQSWWRRIGLVPSRFVRSHHRVRTLGRLQLPSDTAEIAENVDLTAPRYAGIRVALFLDYQRLSSIRRKRSHGRWRRWWWDWMGPGKGLPPAFTAAENLTYAFHVR
jgi:hypothetical protein